MGSCCGKSEQKPRRRGESGAGYPTGYPPPVQDLVPPYAGNVVANDTGTLGSNVRGYVPQVMRAVCTELTVCSKSVSVSV